MTVRTSLLTLLSLIAIPAASFASGSVSFEAIRDLLPADVRAHLEFAFKIGDVGDATRLGKHFGDLSGGRIGPYYFPATSNAKDGRKCTIGIFTEAAILDAKGKEIEDPSKAKDIREIYDFFEVRFAKNGNNPQSGNPDNDAREAAPMTAAERDDIVAGARAAYADVGKIELEFDGGQLQSDDEQSGDVIRGYARNGSIRKVELNVAQGDHGGFKVEIFADRKNRPLFVLWEESYWSFDPNDTNKTIDTVTERRFYFSPQGRLGKALEKSYSGSGERDLRKKRDAAKNSDFGAKPFGVPGFYKALVELVKCEDKRLKAIAGELWDSQDRMIGH